jgi:hypothetical protein
MTGVASAGVQRVNQLDPGLWWVGWRSQHQVMGIHDDIQW